MMSWMAAPTRGSYSVTPELVMQEEIRLLVAKHGRLKSDMNEVRDDQDLFAAGMTSFCAVQLMLAIESAFEVEFPDRMIARSSFVTVNAIASCLKELRVSPKPV